MYALMWSGGKDSCLALARARRQGLAVETLVNFYDAATGRVRFHATRRELIAAQAFALGLRLIQEATQPDTYEAVFRRTLTQLAASGCRGVVFGDIHLADVRAWFEERVTAAGLEHLEPLWDNPSAQLLSEFIDGGCQACSPASSWRSSRGLARPARGRGPGYGPRALAGRRSLRRARRISLLRLRRPPVLHAGPLATGANP